MGKRSSPRTALAVLVALNVLNFYDRQVLGALTEPIRKEFHLSDAQVGLIGSAFIWLYAIVGLPLGRVADRWSRRKLLAAGMVAWSALTAMAAAATNYPTLLLSRLGFAVGEAVVAPAATSWIGDLFPPWERSRALALFMLGVPVGGALTYFFSGPVAQAYGWRAAMLLAAAPVVLLAPMVWRLVEPSRGAADRHDAGSGVSTAAILAIPAMWWIIASGALLNFSMYAVSIFLPAFLSRVHGVTLAGSGIAAGIVFASGGLFGGFVAARLGDWVVHRRKDGRLLCAAATALVGAPFAYLGIRSASLYAAIALIALAYGSLNSYYGLVYSAIQDIVPPAVRGRAMAIYFMAMYLCGASFGPLLTGKLSDRLARRAADAAGASVVTEAFKAIGLQQAMLVIPLLAVALAAVLYGGSRAMAADLGRRKIWSLTDSKASIS